MHHRSTTSAWFTLVLLLCASTETNPVSLKNDDRVVVDQPSTTVLRIASLASDLMIYIAAPAFAATQSDPPNLPESIQSRPITLPLLSHDQWGWLLAGLAGAALAAVALTGRRRSAKVRRDTKIQVQTFEKRLRMTRTAADSERQFLNERNRELQAHVDRMMKEATSERVASLLRPEPLRVPGNFTPLAPMRSARRGRGAAPGVAVEAERMIDAIEKTSDHLQSVEDAAASLVPKINEPPSNVRMFRPARPARRKR